MTIREGLTFDDVLLMPRRSAVFSRKDTSTKAPLSRNISLNIPLVSANMDTVTESGMARAMARMGGIGIIHRFLSIERQVEEVKKVKRAENVIIEDPFTVHPDITLGEAKSYMRREGVSGVLVVKEKAGKRLLVGILTRRDLLFETDDRKKVSSLMSTDLITARPNVSLERARDILHDYRIEKLPLTTKEGYLVGLITLCDIIERMQNPLSSKDKKGRLMVGAAVGVKEDTIARTDALLSAGADVIVIDIAHGHNERAIETTKLLRKTFGKNIEIIAGNIATPEAARDLAKAGADGLKVGIGPGAACTTRIVTGVGVPQLTAIMDVAKEAAKIGIPFIADGGIKNSGDFSKAMAAGADTVMIGNLLAGCKESPGEYILDRGVAYKYYRGMASYDATREKIDVDGGTDGVFRSPEGASGRVAYRGEASMVVMDLIGGLRSSMSYLGAKTLAQFEKNAEFIKMSNAGLTESGPHGVK
ncbi:MAG: IMP dehydrogenase [Candidatus Lloydbacteria bacterium RIFCSPHIGHO2_01_FULL_49_22]|uniref:Inosine-5'-monophosphate dehydrogenase n=1 Tax=Candidatus Lloydbacteria bacterium RIFCSPHIGHO2_01_FULL_49_22 TaxID=1798658 RepID=A0A1G2CW73_9BACT|nr:MAG: IMP dehydrogenase [Candidatus Lloydbacteria bacterium RIFCSPHIGHO2_01_FULL_49_22]OGZ10143.1 MAG: IMP dehydrogenase [Candidatus Lloydbacteria bacterium RIFCSPHIGHO2_02_FULL_50_18]